MIVKELIGVLLLSGGLHVLALSNIDKRSELNEDFSNEQLKYNKNFEKRHREASHKQFEADYYRWDDKKFGKPKYEKFKDDSNFMKLNEIDSHEYVDKYNKYGNTFNPKVAHMQKARAAFHQKRDSESKKHHETHEKPTELFHDVDVNYFNGNTELPLDLSHDVDVNYINNKKKVSGDSELISDNAGPQDLSHDADVNYMNNKKKVSRSGELISENTVQRSKENYEENYQNGNELYMKRFKKDFYQNLNKIDLSNPPPPNDTVLMARYIVHSVDWAALGTISGRSSTKGSPFVCVKATSDGMQNASSGIPFFYMSAMDLCTQDLQKDNRVSVLVTLSQTDYCKRENFDPQDPRCAKLTLSGKIKKIKVGSDEEKFARSALFSRHPAMESWPSDHNWYFTKLKIGQIILLDQFGGATYIKVKDYLNGKVVEPELRK